MNWIAGIAIFCVTLGILNRSATPETPVEATRSKGANRDHGCPSMPPAATCRRAGIPQTNLGAKRSAASYRPNVPESPEERDYRLRRFQVVNPEGEVHTLDTGDISSPFYGPVWTRILDANSHGDFLRGRVVVRRTGRDNRFAGYSVSIDGVEAFLPHSKSSFFYDTERDATRKCLALQVEAVYPNGPKVGNVVVNATAPWKHVAPGLQNLKTGQSVHALAMNYDAYTLIFPAPRGQEIHVLLSEAEFIARNRKVRDEPDFLTGLYWKLRLQEFHEKDRIWTALAEDVLA